MGQKAGKAIMKLDMLGAGCYGYTDEDKPAVVYHGVGNVEVKDGMEKNVCSLELAPEMDVMVSGSEEGLQQDVLVKMVWMLEVEKVKEEALEQEALKEAALTLQVEKVEDHLRVLEYIT